MDKFDHTHVIDRQTLEVELSMDLQEQLIATANNRLGKCILLSQWNYNKNK